MSFRRSTLARVGVSAVVVAGLVGAAGASGVGAGWVTSASSVPADSAPGGASAGADLSGKVFFLLPNATTPRYTNFDAPAFIEAMAEYAPGVEVVVLNAEGDPQKQVQQAETAVSQGALAIVLTAADPNLSSGVLAKAAEGDVPVIAYEHEALGGPVDYFVVFSPYDAGLKQAEFFAAQIEEGVLEAPVRLARLYGNAGDNYNEEMLRGQNEILQPLIDSGDIEVVCEDNTPQWDPAEAQRLMEQCLTRTNNEIDAVLGFYDGIAAGAIAALESQDLAGVVPVYGGQNPELSGLQNMLLGRQVDNILKSYSVEADAAAQLVVAAITGTDPPEGLITGTFDNGSIEVPLAELPVEHFLVDGIQEVVDQGIMTWEQICEGPVAETETCQEQLG